MSVSGTVTPPSGPTPTTFTIEASGGKKPYTLTLAPSPPNSANVPAHTITAVSGRKWEVEITQATDPDREIWFTITDSDGATYDVAYETT